MSHFSGCRLVIVLLSLFLHFHAVTPFQPSSIGRRKNTGIPPNKDRSNQSQICASRYSIVPESKDYVDRSCLWVYMFYLLMVFKEREGHVDVPINHEEDGWELGSWLSNQRSRYKKQLLDPTHIERLEGAGVAWSLHDSKWEAMFGLLQAFKEREGHTFVSLRYKENGKNLGEWLRTQRINHKSGRLLPARRQRLEDSGVSWDPNQAKWELLFTLLTEFQKREGHTRIPRDHQEKGHDLYSWILSQRSMMRRGLLSEERCKRLKDLGIGMPQPKPKPQDWNKMVGLLVQFKDREGHINVRHNHVEGNETLGRWLYVQRQSMRNGKMSHDCQQQLEEIGVPKNAIDKRWDDMYTLLVAYKEREGNVVVCRPHEEEGEPLGTWLAHQRKLMNKGTLDPGRRERLEGLGVELPREKTTFDFQDMFELLVGYKEREGHVEMPYSHKEGGYNLGLWLLAKRKLMMSGCLSDEQCQMLEELGVEPWIRVRHGKSWETMFELLLAYKEREGNVRVPTRHKEEGENLGHWLNNQRRAMKSGSLSAERCQLFKELGVEPNMYRKSWETMHELLVAYKEREGNVRVPRSHKEEGENLGIWLNNQRFGSLSDERCQLLKELGVISPKGKRAT